MEPEERQLRREAVRRRTRFRRLLAAVALLALAAGIGVGAVTGDDGSGEETATAEAAPIELPRGGRRILPRYRLVGYYGAPQDDALGALGIGTPEEASAALRRQARSYRGDRPVLPFMELLATIANADPGDDGTYRTRQSPR